MERRFHVLALSQLLVRVVECDGWNAREVPVEGMPRSLTAAVGEDFEEPSLQLHSAGGAGGGRRPAVFHSRGSANDDTKSELPRFLQRVDAAVCAVPALRDEPLVLAGVGYLTAMYRSLSHHPHLVAAAVTGNEDHLPDAQLGELARAAAGPELHAAATAEAARFRELAGRGAPASTSRRR